MKFEISPKNYHIDCKSYDEAKMYLLFLEIDGKRGWRFPTRYERSKYFRVGEHVSRTIWDQRDDNTILLNNVTRLLIPIRDTDD